MLNATGHPLLSTQDSGFYVAPLLATGSLSGVALAYDTKTKQVIQQTGSNVFFTNIQNLEANTQTIYNLVPRQYQSISTGDTGIGYIAEELVSVDPNLVLQVDGTPMATQWSSIVVFLVEELKKLQLRVAALEGK
jgi:hypothetical protein